MPRRNSLYVQRCQRLDLLSSRFITRALAELVDIYSLLYGLLFLGIRSPITI
jgi:hypothetical protein